MTLLSKGSVSAATGLSPECTHDSDPRELWPPFQTSQQAGPHDCHFHRGLNRATPVLLARLGALGGLLPGRQVWPWEQEDRVSEGASGLGNRGEEPTPPKCWLNRPIRKKLPCWHVQPASACVWSMCFRRKQAAFNITSAITVSTLEFMSN